MEILNARISGMSRKLRSIENGDRFGIVTVLKRYDPDDPARTLIRCDCGVEKSVTAGDVPRLKSCGCLLPKRHGMKDTPTHISWNCMLDRCYNPKQDNYPRYGGRGIRVCDRWRDFTNFYSDMGDRPEGTTIDRINGDGDYEPGNCRWATDDEQRTNLRPSLFDAEGKRINNYRSEWLGGERMTRAEAKAAYGVDDRDLLNDSRKRSCRKRRAADKESLKKRREELRPIVEAARANATFIRFRRPRI